jgi:cytochrome c-type biogenesis protein
MSAVASLAASFAAGVLTSATPCVIAAVPVTVGLVGSQARSTGEAVRLSLAFVAGMTLSFVVLGLVAARLGLFLGIVDPFWGASVGAFVAAAGLWLFFQEQGFAIPLPLAWQRRLRGSGLAGAAILGAVLGTVMSPCATPPLAAALAVAGTGALHDGSIWLGGAMLLAYGLGHSVLLLAAGVAPMQAQHLLLRLNGVQSWLPGRRVFAAVLVLAGGWLIISNMALGWR